MSVNNALIVELKQKTGLGMMACKKALDEANGDIEKAIDELRKKGAVKAAEREGRAANQGVIASYIHGNNAMGALVEINCETDFVAKNEAFVDFANSIAMQVAAMSPLVVSPDDVSEEELDREKGIYIEQLKNEGKKEEMIEKIIEGKLAKFKNDQSLLKQVFIKDQSKKVEEVLLDINNILGENVQIKRFVRFQVGL